MVFKKIFLFVVMTILFISSGCSENNSNKMNEDILLSENEYDFENMTDSNERKVNQHSIEEYEKLQREITNILNSESMNEVIITVNEEEITRGDFETQKMISVFKYDMFSIREIVYSLIKPRVISAEAKRLNLKASQDRVDQYMEGVRLAIAEEQEEKGFIYAHINGKGITIEEYLREQEDLAYNMFQREALYDHIEATAKNEDTVLVDPNAEVDSYVNNLLKYANIQIYDSEIKEACLEH